MDHAEACKNRRYDISRQTETVEGRQATQHRVGWRRPEHNQAGPHVADQVAILAKEGVRRIETNYSEIQVQSDAVEAAKIHLQALEETELIRERLTPEFLLVKLQAQETSANAKRAEIRAIADFNISLVQLAKTLGTVLELHQVETSLLLVLDDNTISD